MKKDKENIVVVYGSGASYASGYKVKVKEEQNNRFFSQSIEPPTDQGFFKQLNRDYLKEEYPALYKFKNEYFDSNSEVGMEEVWTAIDLNHKHISLGTYHWTVETDKYDKTKYPDMDLDQDSTSKKGMTDTSPQYNKYKFLGDCGRDFRKLIHHVYSDFEISNDKNCFQQLHKSIVDSQHCLIGYITFNYDCYLEDALKDAEFKYIHANSDTQTFNMIRHGGIPIVKLHGSLSWEEKLNGLYYRPEQHAPPFDKDSQKEPSYNNDSRWAQPAIIPPTIFKQEINDDSRTQHPLTQMILQQWRTAIIMLREADKIIFVGYSFPVSDFHAKRIFQIANMIRREELKKKMADIIYCVGPSDDSDYEKKCRNNIIDIFGSKSNIDIIFGFDDLLKSKELEDMLSNYPAASGRGIFKNIERPKGRGIKPQATQ